MKKLTALALSTASFLAATAPAFADPVTIDSCPKEGAFKGLCDAFGGPEAASNVIGQLISLLMLGAVILALFFLVYGGIRWVISGGDKAKVETARQTIVAAIIGLVVVFLAYFIINLVLQIFGIGNVGSITIPRLVATPK